ncbi:MAG: hypothetical protein M1814_005722 [Vezdaea aestivalis]|nr:MAG: hypothetical protein M1814_005722 [Vezdaea aestivalis]
MHNNRAHHFLAQIPLTVSPFVSLPTSTSLPYTYKTLPSTLPPSSTSTGAMSEKPQYVVSASGHAAHPDDIIESCRALQRHLQKLQEDADRTLKDWQESIKSQELAEKRRIAPGWLDRDERILEPKKRSSIEGAKAPLSHAGAPSNGQISHPMHNQEGQDIDRAFGGLQIH